MKNLLDRIYDDVLKKFENDQHRLNHILGSVKMAKMIAKDLNINENKCSIIALLHDFMKNDPLDIQLKYLSEEEVSKIETNVLIHAISASNYAKEVYGITDIEILNAIRSHVYGNLEMSIYDKVMLISDFCEETRQYPYCLLVREYVNNKDYNKALKETINYTIKSLIQRDIKPTKEQIEIQRKYG